MNDPQNIFARMPAIAPEPGIYNGIGFSDYCRWRAWNMSTLSWLGEYSSVTGRIESADGKSPRHMLEYLLGNIGGTDAQEFGIGYHTLIFERAHFAQRYHVLKRDYNLRTKADKEEWAALAQQFGEDAMVEKSTWETWCAMAHSLAQNAGARQLINAVGESEVSGVFKEEETGLTCKVRLDRLCYDAKGTPVIIDLKTARRAHVSKFAWDAGEFMYHAKAAIYCEAIRVLTGKTPHFRLVVQEKTFPYIAVVYKFREEEMDSGLRIARGMLRLADECVQKNHFPGYADERVVDLFLHERFHADEPASVS